MNLDDFHYRLKIYYQKNDETHAHKNTIHRYGTPSLWNTRKKKYFSFLLLREYLVAACSTSFFPSFSSNITRDAHNSNDKYFILQSFFFFFFIKHGGRKGRGEYFSVERRGATRSTTDDRGPNVRVRAHQVTRQCSIEAKKSNAGVDTHRGLR